MSDTCEFLQAIVLDWAGTAVDYGSRAPAFVFQEIFRRRGVPITPAQAREPMGMAKREHIATIAAMPDVSNAWQARFGAECSEADIDQMYADFLPLQKETLAEHCDLIPGVADAVTECRRMGLKIGSSTGYTRELMDVVVPRAKEQGYEPDLVLCSEDAPRGRPAPYLLYTTAIQLDVFPLSTIVKVDDTVAGIIAGRNAGCWTVGVTRSGNCVGLSQAELVELSDADVAAKCEAAAAQLREAGAHAIIESVADLPAVLRDFEQRMANGETPEK